MSRGENNVVSLDAKRVAKGVENQPISTVHWIERRRLRANAYNPNKVAPPEMKLLRISILADGWTQPLVVRPIYLDEGSPLGFHMPPDEEVWFEVVDGFHRWTVSQDPEIAALTDGKVPCVIVVPEIEDQMMSTIRHNRARGTHAVLPMADIVRSLIDERGMLPEEVAVLLQMEDEEVERLYDRSGMPTRGGSKSDAFGRGWTPEWKPKG